MSLSRYAELRPLLLFLFAGLAGWAFAALAGEVIDGDTHAFDEAVLDTFRAAGPQDPIGPIWLEDMARDITSLGSTGILSLVTVGAVVYLVLAQKRSSALFVLASVLSGTVVSTILKELIARDRPDAIYQVGPTFTASFPSGHSLLSAVVYLTLGTLLMRAQPRRRMKSFVMGLAIMIVLMVGITRAYLGVHWATDVLAGWLVGAGWAALCWLVMYALQERRAVERSDEGGA